MELELIQFEGLRLSDSVYRINDSNSSQVGRECKLHLNTSPRAV
ncbi:hypothetical protein VCRA217O17_170110 [Vibrio crassostreae]|nr:hypothetical protein VCRA217O17_170110 [Vibrio crassostreae]